MVFEGEHFDIDTYLKGLTYYEWDLSRIVVTKIIQ